MHLKDSLNAYFTHSSSVVRPLWGSLVGVVSSWDRKLLHEMRFSGPVTWNRKLNAVSLMTGHRTYNRTKGTQCFIALIYVSSVGLTLVLQFV